MVACRSRGHVYAALRGRILRFDLGPCRRAHAAQIVVRLQVQPQLRAGSEILGEPQRRIAVIVRVPRTISDTRLTGISISRASRLLADAQRPQILLEEDLAGRDGVSFFAIVMDLFNDSRRFPRSRRLPSIQRKQIRH